jgi:hypothetical protein
MKPKYLALKLHTPWCRELQCQENVYLLVFARKPTPQAVGIGLAVHVQDYDEKLGGVTSSSMNSISSWSFLL